MQSDPIRRRAVVRGRVQGVFFRDSVRERAEEEGVSGWAHNRDDGSVEVVLEGSPEAVQAVAAFLQSGSPRARVEDVELTDEPPEGLTGFEIV
jgi:acylphosphatase